MQPTRGEKILAAFQAVFFAWSAVFAMATDVVSVPEALVRPLVVAAVTALVVFGLALFATRSWTLAALLASGFMLFTVRQPAAGLALIALACWWLLIGFLRRRAGRPAPRPGLPRFVARAAGIFSIALVAVTGWNLFAEMSAGVATWERPSYTAEGSSGPNVYVLLVDGYPRADTLQETFDIDNGPFLAELEELGFAVSDEAQSNYNKTWLTLASMLNGEYIDRMLEGPIVQDASIQMRWVARMIDGAATFDAFHERGYFIRSIPSPFTSTMITSADEVMDLGGMTELEIRLISHSPWAQIFRDQTLEFLSDTQRTAVQRSLDTTAELAEARGESPQLVISHVHSPHTPFVLHPEGTQQRPAPACQPTFCPFWNATIQELEMSQGEFREGLVLQIEELNRRLLATVRRIVEADPSAIVVLLSDHGIRYSLFDVDEHFRILLASRAPGGDALLSNDESPVNVLRSVLDRIGEEIPLLEYERWDADWARMLDMRRHDD